MASSGHIFGTDSRKPRASAEGKEMQQKNRATWRHFETLPLKTTSSKRSDQDIPTHSFKFNPSKSRARRNRVISNIENRS